MLLGLGFKRNSPRNLGQTGNKKCYIPKVRKFYIKYGYLY